MLRPVCVFECVLPSVAVCCTGHPAFPAHSHKLAPPQMADLLEWRQSLAAASAAAPEYDESGNWLEPSYQEAEFEAEDEGQDEEVREGGGRVGAPHAGLELATVSSG